MTDIERFWAKVSKTATCWLWTAYTHPNGYGQAWWNKRNVYAHRMGYELAYGPISEGMVIDHLCRVRNCVRPEHMEVTTNGANVLRGIGISALNARRKSCIHGHLLDGENLLVYDGYRVCRTCKNNRQNARHRALATYRRSMGLPTR